MMLPPDDGSFGLEPYFAYLRGEPARCQIYGRDFPPEEIEALLALAPDVHWQYQRRNNRITLMRFTDTHIATYDIPCKPDMIFNFEVWRCAVQELMSDNPPVCPHNRFS